MNTFTATFLIVEEGEIYTVTANSAEEMINKIRTRLDGKTVMTELTATETDDPIDIVSNMTDGDPLADLTTVEAADMIQRAKDIGYSVPESLTPELFVELYESMKNETEE